MAEAAKQQEEKYKKINERLYQEQRGDDRPFNWAKKLEPLYVELFDTEISLSGSIEREIEPFSFGKPADEAGDEADQVRKLDERTAQKVMAQGKKASVARTLRAKAKFDSRRRINVFENGNISRTYYETADFICKEGEGAGTLLHMSGSVLNYVRDHSDPHIAIKTYLPAELFQPIVQQIEAGKAVNVQASLDCDVFQSEMERALAEPYMTQEYTIEEGSANFCGLNWINVAGTKYNPLPLQHEEDGDEDSHMAILPATADASERLQARLLNELHKTNRFLKNHCLGFRNPSADRFFGTALNVITGFVETEPPCPFCF